MRVCFHINNYRRVWLAAGLIASVFSSGSLFAGQKEYDVIQARLEAIAPARIHVQKNLDHGVISRISVSVVDLFKDRTATALAFSPQQPDQQTLYFHGKDRTVRYDGGAFTADGRVVVSGPPGLILSATVYKRRGQWDHPAYEAMQLPLAALLDSVDLEVNPLGEFFYTNPVKKVCFKGLYSHEFQMFRTFTHIHDKGEVTYEYGNFTKFHGEYVAQSLVTTAKATGSTFSRSNLSFVFEEGKGLISPLLNLNPPLRTLVVDERFTPSLSYYSEKESYKDEELVLMHQNQVLQKGAYVSSAGEGSRIRPYQWMAVTMAILIPVISGYNIFIRRDFYKK